uniref:Uncharacterized protein n=1 Tax=Monodelphis domestica TaxID=13616 RepID=A0A5F8GQM2_MONDO
LTARTVHAGNLNFKWDPKSLEIRTLAVERLFEPLETQVTTLESQFPPRRNLWLL